MSEAPNYEATGRYFIARENVERLQSRRHNLAGELGQSLKKAAMMFSDTVQIFDHVTFEKKAKELADINAELEMALAEMDAAASEAKRPPFRRG